MRCFLPLVAVLAGLACGPWGPQGILPGGPLLGKAEPGVFAGSASRVSDPTEGAAVARRFVEKYVGLAAPDARWLLDPPGPGDDRFDVWLLRIDPAEPA